MEIKSKYGEIFAFRAQKKKEEKMEQAKLAAERKAKKAPKYTQAECQEKLRKWVEKAPIPPIQKRTLTNISKVFVAILHALSNI